MQNTRKAFGHQHAYTGHSRPFNWDAFHAWKQRQQQPVAVAFTDDVRTRFACEVMNRHHSKPSRNALVRTQNITINSIRGKEAHTVAIDEIADVGCVELAMAATWCLRQEQEETAGQA